MSVQILERPSELPHQNVSMSMLMPSYTSNIVEVQREQEAFPFSSLVADIGGVLGLFIGFNFLMVWDFAVLTAQRVWHKNVHLFNCILSHNK